MKSAFCFNSLVALLIATPKDIKLFRSNPKFLHRYFNDLALFTPSGTISILLVQELDILILSILLSSCLTSSIYFLSSSTSNTLK